MTRKRGAKTGRTKRRARRPRGTALTTAAAVRQVDAIRREIERAASRRLPRWNADPEDVRRSVMKLVLTLVELIRQILERQAIRRMENRTLTAEETENVGTALMRLQETITDLAAQFDIDPSELNLDLGPIG
ncbi:MAG TPA: gas vesicle protein K, partial [Vicinamibacterales bacterium]|nr:gas vesicle protein K [Vicinamibacterales bacterium]